MAKKLIELINLKLIIKLNLKYNRIFNIYVKIFK